MPSNSSVVCIHHFDKKYITYEDVVTRNDGTVIRSKRTRPRLDKSAIPSLFHGQPSYMATSSTAERHGVERRVTQLEERDEQAMASFNNGDEIESFLDFQGEFADKFSNLHFNRYHIKFSNNVTFMKHDAFGLPKIVAAFNVLSDLTIKIHHNDIVLPSIKFEWLLGIKLMCDKWSKFKSLISHLWTYTENIPCVSDKLSYIPSLASEVIEEKLGVDVVI